MTRRARAKEEKKKRISAVFAMVVYAFTMVPFGAFADNARLQKNGEQSVHTQNAITQDALNAQGLAHSNETFENEALSSSSLIKASVGGTVKLGKASIVIPAGALEKDTEIKIERLREVADTGERLYNATAGATGYRFLPAGTQFRKEVEINLPYNKTLNVLPQGTDDLLTYYYDTGEEKWVALEKKAVDKDEAIVKSSTTHFTDMINGTLTLPENASPLELNINSIKELEAANPLAGIIQFKMPEANHTGDASISANLDIPQGRRGMQPALVLTYSSGSGNGIVGKGFDLQYGSSITRDTRFGVPKYEDDKDRFMLDGVLLEKDEKASNSEIETRYVPLKQEKFERIIHYKNDKSDYWEVTEQDGFTESMSIVMKR